MPIGHAEYCTGCGERECKCNLDARVERAATQDVRSECGKYIVTLSIVQHAHGLEVKSVRVRDYVPPQRKERCPYCEFARRWH